MTVEIIVLTKFFKAQRGHEGALLPFHIREAVRRLSEVEGSNCFDFKRKRKRLF